MRAGVVGEDDWFVENVKSSEKTAQPTHTKMHKQKICPQTDFTPLGVLAGPYKSMRFGWATWIVPFPHRVTNINKMALRWTSRIPLASHKVILSST